VSRICIELPDGIEVSEEEKKALGRVIYAYLVKKEAKR